MYPRPAASQLYLKPGQAGPPEEHWLLQQLLNTEGVSREHKIPPNLRIRLRKWSP
ncbi:hypothetical protein LEMLEM_LOCUS27120 [Lemmus lemmus]